MMQQQAVEAILFIAGDEGVTVSELTDTLAVPADDITDAIVALTEKYQNDATSALTVIQADDRVRLVTKAALSDLVHDYLTAPLTTALSQASLEVLAIIAYKQPITRVDIDEIRGVQSQATIQKLALRQLVQATGRAEEPGRPKLYGTTDYFLDYFGLANLKEMPPLGSAATLDALREESQQGPKPLLPGDDENDFTSAFDLTETETIEE